MISATHVANNIIKRGNETGTKITPLKLQKLVYYVYKMYLQKTGKKLFSEQFETWKYGPVVPSIYTEFGSYGRSPIKSFALDSRGKCFIITEDGVFKECLDSVWDKMGKYSGETLSSFTHQDGTAWSKAKDRKSKFLDCEEIMNEPDPRI